MNLKNLLIEVSGVTGQPQTIVKPIVEASMQAIIGALADGETVLLKGFGSFTPEEKPARDGRNPRTGEPIAIRASVKVKFKPAQAMKEAVQ